MNLSKLILNPSHAQVRKDLQTPYDLHRSLSRGFGKRATTTPGRILFRLEESNQRDRYPTALVQSEQEQPDWSSLLQSNYLLAAYGPKPFTLNLRQGQQLAFRLLGNPVRKTRLEGRKHAVRVPLFHATRAQHDDKKDGYLDWLQRQAQNHGFKVLWVRDTPLPRQAKPLTYPSSAKQGISHWGVRFDGHLLVENPDAVRQAVRTGIGPAKSFGFGLLSLAPA